MKNGKSESRGPGISDKHGDWLPVLPDNRSNRINMIGLIFSRTHCLPDTASTESNRILII